MYLLTIMWIIFRALIHFTRPGLYVKPAQELLPLVQREAYWPCLPWVLSFFNVFFSLYWLRRRSTKPALLYAILRNLKILVLKRRCVLDSFIGTINRHRGYLMPRPLNTQSSIGLLRPPVRSRWAGISPKPLWGNGLHIRKSCRWDVYLLLRGI